MGKTNHTCNLDCKQRWSMFIFKSFYIRSLQKQSFFSHTILIFRKLHNNANGQNIHFIQESFVFYFEKCRFLINTEYNHVCFNNIVFDISYQQFLPVWNPTEEVIDIIFKY